MKYWCENSAVLTHYYNGLSVIFPAWEELWCKVMEAHKDKITDPELLSDMNKFIKQETSHSKAHHALNKNIDGGLELEEFQRHRAEILAKRPASSTLLGAMVSIEYIAASISKDIINRYSNETSKQHRVFVWHAHEEIEHIDVAYRVWEKLAKDKKQLKKIAMTNFRTVLGFAVKYTWNKCREDKILWNPSTWFDLSKLMLRIFTSAFIPYTAILKDSFNPSKLAYA